MWSKSILLHLNSKRFLQNNTFLWHNFSYHPPVIENCIPWWEPPSNLEFAPGFRKTPWAINDLISFHETGSNQYDVHSTCSLKPFMNTLLTFHTWCYVYHNMVKTRCVWVFRIVHNDNRLAYAFTSIDQMTFVYTACYVWIYYPVSESEAHCYAYWGNRTRRNKQLINSMALLCYGDGHRRHGSTSL